MLALPNPFYRNPEANARHQLLLHMLCDAQKSMQQTVMELWTLRSFFSQGQLFFCIPVGCQGNPLLPQVDYPIFPQVNYPPSAPPPPVANEVQKPSETVPTRETKLHVSLKNERRKCCAGADDCKLTPECVEIVLDMRPLLPAEISVCVDERCVRVEAYRTEREGTKHFWKQFDLPSCVLAEAARCLLSHDGFLHISVPWHMMET